MANKTALEPFFFASEKPALNLECFLTYECIKHDKAITRKGYIVGGSFTKNGYPYTDYFDLDKNAPRRFSTHNFMFYSFERVSFWKTNSSNDERFFLIKMIEVIGQPTRYKVAIYSDGDCNIFCNDRHQEYAESMLKYCEETTEQVYTDFLNKIIL